MGDGAQGHGAGHGFAHGAVGGDQPGRHAQQFGLGFVGIGDEAALKPLAGACQVGAGGGDHAAGAALGGGQHQVAGLQGRADLFGQGVQGVVVGKRVGVHGASLAPGRRRGHPAGGHGGA